MILVDTSVWVDFFRGEERTAALSGLLETNGIGWVDCQLVASALIAEAALWTLDEKLAAVADELGLASA